VRSPSHANRTLDLKVKKTAVNDAATLRQATVTAYGPIGLVNRFFAKIIANFRSKLKIVCINYHH
jgi:hypothetical protein